MQKLRYALPRFGFAVFLLRGKSAVPVRRILGVRHLNLQPLILDTPSLCGIMAEMYVPRNVLRPGYILVSRPLYGRWDAWQLWLYNAELNGLLFLV